MRIYSLLILLTLSHTVNADSIFIIPGKSWGLQFDSPMLLKQQASASETHFQFNGSSAEGFIVSGFVEPAEDNKKTSLDCKNFYWKLAAQNKMIKKETVKETTTDKFAVVNYQVDGEFQGKNFTQENANYYAFRDGKCIDIHVSHAFIEGKKVDVSHLQEFAKSVRFFN